MSAYTGEPWQLQFDGNGFDVIGGMEEGPHYSHDVPGLEMRPRQRIIGRVFGSDAEGAANAALILAAPRLLRMLEKIVDTDRIAITEMERLGIPASSEAVELTRQAESLLCDIQKGPTP